jgi:hypothetical protein
MQRVSSVVLLLAGLVLLILVSVYLVLIEFQKRAALSAVGPYSYIPADAGMVCTINKPFEFATTFEKNNPFPKEITNILPIRRFRDLLIKADSVFNSDEDSRVIPENTSLIISWHRMEKPDESTWLFVIALPHRSKAEKSALHITEQLFPDSPIQKTDTANIRLYNISTPDKHEDLHFSTDKNFVVLSKDKDLIFKSLYAGRNQTGLADSPGTFSDLISAKPKETDCLFIEPSLFCDFITDYFFWDHPLSIDCSSISGWLSLKVSRDEKIPGFDGFLVTQRQTPGIFSILNFQEPSETHIKEFIIQKPSLLYHHHLPDTELFDQDFSFVLQQNKKYSLFELHKRRFSDVAGISTDSISGYWTGELAMVLPGEQQWQNEYPVVLLGIKNFEKLLQHPRLGIFFLTPAYDDETNHLPGRLFEISIPGFFQVFTHGLVKDDLKWAILKNDFIVASAKKENLIKYIEILHNEEDTITAPNEMFLQNTFNDKHNIMLYISVPRLMETFEIMFTDKFLNLQEYSKLSIPDLDQMILQFSSGPGDKVNSGIRFSSVNNLLIDSLFEIRHVNLTHIE